MATDDLSSWPADLGYEPKDTNVRVVVNFIAALTIFLIIVQLVLWVMFKSLTGDRPESAAALSMPPMAEGEYQKLREREEAVLNGSGWVDKAEGKVRIPIDRAIELLSERGLRPIGGGKTEAQMNSHSGRMVPAESTKDLRK